MDLGPPTLETPPSRQATRKGNILRSPLQAAPLFHSFIVNVRLVHCGGFALRTPFTVQYSPFVLRLSWL